MKRFLPISIGLLFLISCKGYFGPKVHKTDYIQGHYTVTNNYFTNIGEEHIFRANVEAFKKELSGLLVVKRINEELYRIVLTSDFGNTLFDFSIYKSKPYEVNYAMPDLNKKVILNFLAKDFTYLVEDTYILNGKAILDSINIYRGNYRNKKIFIVIDQHGEVKEIIAASASKEKVVFLYSKENGAVIKHRNFPVKIELISLKQN